MNFFQKKQDMKSTYTQGLVVALIISAILGVIIGYINTEYLHIDLFTIDILTGVVGACVGLQIKKMTRRYS